MQVGRQPFKLTVQDGAHRRTKSPVSVAATTASSASGGMYHSSSGRRDFGYNVTAILQLGADEFVPISFPDGPTVRELNDAVVEAIFAFRHTKSAAVVEQFIGNATLTFNGKPILVPMIPMTAADSYKVDVLRSLASKPPAERMLALQR